MKILFENENIIVVSQIFDNDRVVLSFCPLLTEGQITTENSGFGYKLFNKNQISAIYFIPKWNFWYQSEYLDHSLELVLDEIKGFKEVITYGVSMGGYAALRYSNYFNASKILAFCPTVLLSKDKGSFDKRYIKYLDKLVDRSDTWLEHFNHKAEAIIIYDDQHHPDNKHIDALLTYGINIDKLNIAFSAHGAFGLLNECGILSEVSITLITTDYQKNKIHLKNLIKAHRGTSCVPWMIAATYSSARGRQISAARLYEKALNIVKHRHQNNLTIDIPNSNLLIVSAFTFFIHRQQIDKFIAFYEDLVKMNLPYSLLHTFAERYETLKHRPKVDWIVGPSHVIRWQEHIKNNVVPSQLQANNFMGIAGAPIWSKRQLDIVTQKVGNSSVAILVPDFRFGNAICLESPAIKETMADGYLAIDQRAMSNECSQHLVDRSVSALKIWHSTFGTRARYVFWCLFGRQVMDRLQRRHIVNNEYRHPVFNYNEIAAQLADLNIIDLSPLLLRIPIHDIIRLFLDSSCHPTYTGYLFLDKILVKGLGVIEAYHEAVNEVESILLTAAKKIADNKGGKVLLTGHSVWIDTLIRYLGAYGAKKLAEAGLIIAPIVSSPVYCPPIRDIISTSMDLQDYQSVFIVAARGVDLSPLLSSQSHTNESIWRSFRCIDWESATIPVIEARREKPAFQKIPRNPTDTRLIIQPQLSLKDVEFGAAGTPSFSGILTLLELMASDTVAPSLVA